MRTFEELKAQRESNAGLGSLSIVEVKIIMDVDKNLRGADLYGADLTRANLRGADLYGADLTRANLRDANLRDANLRDADLTRADLTRADLYGANLTRADLYGANLTRANLYGANLTRANLRCANLTRANLGKWRHILQLGPMGSRRDYLVVHWHKGSSTIQAGCFSGNLEDFKNAVAQKPEGDDSRMEYEAVIVLLKTRFAQWQSAMENERETDEA